MSIFVVDTNVVVAALLTNQVDSPVARILDGMLAGGFLFALSVALIAEYRTVLMRRKPLTLHGLSATQVETILIDLTQLAIVLRSQPSVPAPDKGDQFLWDLLAARADLVLLTGDKRLLRDKLMQGRIIEPRAFCDQHME